MRAKLWLVMAVALLLILSAGCTVEEDVLQTAEIYVKSMNAMSEVNSYSFDMEMDQVITYPESITELGFPEEMETTARGKGRAIQDPLAMYMTYSISIPFLADIPEAEGFGGLELQIYIVDNMMYMYESMADTWISQDLSAGTDEMFGLDVNDSDPMELLALLGEDGAAESSLKTVDGKYYLITLEDKDGKVMQRIMDDYIKDEVKSSFADMLIDTELFEELFDSITFSDISYKLYIDMETFFATKVTMAYGFEMQVEGEVFHCRQSMAMTFAEFGTFDSITVPEDVKKKAVSFQELLDM